MENIFNFRRGDMSESVKFVLYYGPGIVRANEWGADLSEFTSVELDLDAPETVSIDQLKLWFTANFGLNTGTHTVSVQSLWTKSCETIFWELKTINRNSQWLGWLAGCKRRGIPLVALVLPAINEVEAPEGDGGSDQVHSSARSSGDLYLSHSGSDNLSHTGGGGYDPG